MCQLIDRRKKKQTVRGRGESCGKKKRRMDDEDILPERAREL
jgi:hypothetical protein